MASMDRYTKVNNNVQYIASNGMMIVLSNAVSKLLFHGHGFGGGCRHDFGTDGVTR